MRECDSTESSCAGLDLRLLEALPIPAFIHRIDANNVRGQFVAVNQEACRLTGYSRDELLRLGPAGLEGPLGPTSGEAPVTWTRRPGREPAAFEQVLKTRDGGLVQVEMSTNLLDLDGTVHELSLARDLTSRCRSEAEANERRDRQAWSRRMEAIALLAGGIAHNFNNLLQGVIGNASLLLADQIPGTEAHEETLAIERSAKRAADLVGQLLAFAGRAKGSEKLVDLHAVIHDIAALIGRTGERRITVREDCRAAYALVRGDPSLLHQAVLNLALNAQEAVPESGEIRFETGVVENTSASTPGNEGLAPGRYLKLAVIDTGRGFPAAESGRIFEPFYTTKDPGRAAGLGLAVVHGIARDHGGRILAHSTPGEGARFELLLPLAEVSAPGVGPPAVEGIVPGTGHVMVIDDEEEVLLVAQRMLGRLGYTVTAVPGAVEGVLRFRQLRGQVDLVLLDLVMPEMNGHDCFRALRAIDPEVAVVLSTGHGPDGRADQLLAEGVLALVPKPYRYPELSQLLAQLMEKRRAETRR